MTYDVDAPEKLDRDELAMLKARLALVGSWTYCRGTGGIHRAERGGTHRYEQAALTADGLVEACEQAEVRINSGQRDHAVPISTGLDSTNT